MKLPLDWEQEISQKYSLDYLDRIEKYLETEYQEKTIYPVQEDIFNALKMCTYKNTKVIIIGQDPYHNPHQAHGLAFSVQKGVRTPPSLLNIYKELKANYGYEIPSHGNLTSWAEQGVLLLNAILTVEENKPLSHKNLGWQELLSQVVSVLNDNDTPKVFVLWGNNAKNYAKLITNPHHLIITSSHPSPLSARHSFFGSKVFLRINEFMRNNHREEINFEIK